MKNLFSNPLAVSLAAGSLMLSAWCMNKAYSERRWITVLSSSNPMSLVEAADKNRDGIPDYVRVTTALDGLTVSYRRDITQAELLQYERMKR